MKKLLLLPLLMITCFCFAQDGDEIIGKSIKIGNLLVAENDFPNRMRWEDAKSACMTLGKGWRLPTKKELNYMCQIKDKIPNFTLSDYWSLTEKNEAAAWRQLIKTCEEDWNSKGTLCKIRAVKSL